MIIRAIRGQKFFNSGRVVMKIAFTTKGTTWDSMMDPRFGRTEYILVYDDVEDKFSHHDNHAIANEAHGKELSIQIEIR